MQAKIEKNVPLAAFTSFGIGGAAENFIQVTSSDELLKMLQETTLSPIWLLGFGSNSLISDQGLPGITICLRGGKITKNKSALIVDAGVWWDDVVTRSIEEGLWGIEFLSMVPGSVGAALFINITAYGQSIGSLVEWVEIWDQTKMELRRIDRSELRWEYKKSIFQLPQNTGWIIVRACLQLSKNPPDELKYQKALDVAKELNLETNTLENRRTIIIEARRRAGSLWSPDDTKASRTVGSFFRNPIVTEEQAAFVSSFDESGKTLQEIKIMNVVHGGRTTRVSAAHVLLAAGFTRGQQWGNVKLNNQNLLKIEALKGATAQEVYDVVSIIEKTCWDKLGICLEPEARILGEF